MAVFSFAGRVGRSSSTSKAQSSSAVDVVTGSAIGDMGDAAVSSLWDVELELSAVIFVVAELVDAGSSMVPMARMSVTVLSSDVEAALVCVA